MPPGVVPRPAPPLALFAPAHDVMWCMLEPCFLGWDGNASRSCHVGYMYYMYLLVTPTLF